MLRKNASATRRVRATPRLYRMAIPFDNLDLRPDIPDALPNGKIPIDKLTTPLLVNAPLWDKALPGDAYHLLLITPGSDPRFVDVLTLTAPLSDPVPLHVPVDELANLDDGLHMVVFGILTPAFDWLVSREFIMEIDRSAPGGPLLPAIVFDRDIEENGLTLAKLIGMPNEELVGRIPNYDGIAIGDVIYLKMKLRPDGPEIDAGTLVVTRPHDEIFVRYDRVTLERITSWGIVDFYYYVVDEAGNAAPDPSVDKPIAMWITGAPSLLLPPLIPGFDVDGIVTDPDARPYLLVRIPAYEPEPLIGDYFIVHVGNQALQTPPIQAGDIGNDPVLDVEFPYASLFQSSVPPISDIFDVDVWYDVVRGGLSSPSPAKHVYFNLSIPGGPDPDPGTPINEALGTPWIQGASGGPINIIPPGDTRVDAVVTIPWFNTLIPPSPSFIAGDRIQLYLDATPAGVPYLVTAQDERDATNLELPMPAAAMQAHIGTPDLWYDVSRTLSTVPPQVVTVQSPRQEIAVLSDDDLPGGGELTKAIWLAAIRHQPPQQIDYNDVVRDDGTFVRIHLYDNAAVDDRLDWQFLGYRTTTPGADPIEGTRHVESYVLVSDDLIPKEDDSVVPPGKTRFVDVHVPRNKFEPENDDPIDYGSATFDYSATNDAGKAVAVQAWTYVAMRHSATRVSPENSRRPGWWHRLWRLFKRDA